MAGTGAFSLGTYPRVNGPKTSIASQGFSALWPATDTSTAASPAQPIPDPFASSTSGMPYDQAIEIPLSSTPKNTFSFGQSPSGTIKQERSSNSRPAPLFGRLSSASPAPPSPLRFSQMSAPSTTLGFSFGSANPASPAPQLPFNLCSGTPGLDSATFSASGTTQAANLATKSRDRCKTSVDSSSNPSSSCVFCWQSWIDVISRYSQCPIEPWGFQWRPHAQQCCHKLACGLWHHKKHTDLIVTCGEGAWQCHKATLLPRCPAFEEAYMAHASDGKHELKLEDQKPEVVEGLLIYLYTYVFPKFAAAGDASVAMHLGNLYSVTKFVENARFQILERIKNFGQMGNEDVTSWVQNFELWWGPHQTAMEDIKTEALKLIDEKAEQFTRSNDFVDLLERNKDLRIDVFETMAAHKRDNAVEHEAADVAEQIRVSNSQLRERSRQQFRSKVKELNSAIKEKQNELDAALAEKDALQKRLESAEGTERQTGSQGSVQPSIFANGAGLFGVSCQRSEAGVSSFFGTYSTGGKLF